MRLKTFLTLMGGATSELVADSLLKSWSLTNSHLAYAIGLVLYTLSGVIWSATLHVEPMSKSSVLFFSANGVLCVLVGILYFGEKMTSLAWAGIVAGMLSVALLSLAGNPEGALGGR